MLLVRLENWLGEPHPSPLTSSLTIREKIGWMEEPLDIHICLLPIKRVALVKVTNHYEPSLNKLKEYPDIFLFIF
jgi:hypothetical protein